VEPNGENRVKIRPVEAEIKWLTEHTHARAFCVCPFSRTTQVSRYQKGKTNPDITEARDSEWQWHQLGQVCLSLQTDKLR